MDKQLRIITWSEDHPGRDALFDAYVQSTFVMGFNREILMAKNLRFFYRKAIRMKSQSLIAKKILKGKRPHKSEINPDMKCVLDTLFFPDRVLVVVRNVADYGHQVFYVMEKGKSLVLHSFPKEKEHFIQPVSQSINLFLFLLIGSRFPDCPFLQPDLISPRMYSSKSNLLQKAVNRRKRSISLNPKR